MKDFAKKYLNSYNGFSKIVKILLCLLWDIPSTLYRFSKSALKENTLGMILAIVLGLFGGWILFVIDIVSLLIKDKLLWLDDFGLDEDKMATTTKSEEAPQAEAPAKEEKKEEAPAEDDSPAVDGEIED